MKQKTKFRISNIMMTFLKHIEKLKRNFYYFLKKNLSILDSVGINKFPDTNYHDGITHVFWIIEYYSS